MGDLTKNISRREVACHCGCGFDTIDIKTAELVQKCCDHFAEKLGLEKVILHVISGARCEDHNRKVRGAAFSKHVEGRAMDFTIEGVPPWEIQRYLRETYNQSYGIGNYETFTHFDTRSGLRARW